MLDVWNLSFLTMLYPRPQRTSASYVWAVMERENLEPSYGTKVLVSIVLSQVSCVKAETSLVIMELEERAFMATSSTMRISRLDILNLVCYQWLTLVKTPTVLSFSLLLFHARG